MALIENKKAHLRYQTLKTYEAGMELRGSEVKSLRAKRGVLDGARILVRGGEAYLVGASIPAYQPKNAPPDYDPARTRRLLLTKKEITALATAGEQRGLTIVPLSVYGKGRTLKLSLAVVRGRKKYDKRQLLKKRETEREVRRTLKLR